MPNIAIFSADPTCHYYNLTAQAWNASRAHQLTTKSTKARVQAWANCAGAALLDTAFVVPKALLGASSAPAPSKPCVTKQRVELQGMGLLGMATSCTALASAGVLTLASVAASTAYMCAIGAELGCRENYSRFLQWPGVAAIACIGLAALYAPFELCVVAMTVACMVATSRYPGRFEETTRSIIQTVRPAYWAVEYVCAAVDTLRKRRAVEPIQRKHHEAGAWLTSALLGS
jgi:hypothetical protein